MSAILPSITVIVPFKESEICVLDCLKSIYEMSYPSGKLEVIAVDDSSDGAISDEVLRRFPATRILRNEPPRGCDGSKQAGMDAATGDIIACTDADCIVCPEWARLAAKNLEGGADAVTGPVRHPKSFLRELVGVADFQDYQGITNLRTDAFPGCNFAARRELIRTHGYDRVTGMRFGSDRLASWYLHFRGHNIAYEPGMMVEHRPCTRIGSILERRLRYGKKAFALRKLDPTLPGAAIVRLGPMAAPAYLGYKSAKDLYSVVRAARHGAINPWHAPFLLPALFVFRVLDAVGIMRGQISTRAGKGSVGIRRCSGPISPDCEQSAWDSPAGGIPSREKPQSTMSGKAG